MALLCVLLVALSAAVQVMHHCTALELNSGQPLGPAFCAVCMTAAVATPAIAALVIALYRILLMESAALPMLAYGRIAAFSLYIRPPPAI